MLMLAFLGCSRCLVESTHVWVYFYARESYCLCECVLGVRTKLRKQGFTSARRIELDSTISGNSGTFSLFNYYFSHRVICNLWLLQERRYVTKIIDKILLENIYFILYSLRCKKQRKDSNLFLTCRILRNGCFIIGRTDSRDIWV